MSLRLLVLDAYSPEGRAALRRVGAKPAGELYAQVLAGVAPDVEVEIGFPADGGDGLPPGRALRDYDGMCWTGSSLTIHVSSDPRVERQLELARAAYRAGLPAFGSCWAAQLAVTAAGGRCAPSPRGREFGVARTIALSAPGRDHPLHRGRPTSFAALTSHADEVVELPPGALVLASNGWSRVQAVAVEHAPGSFWAVQYHPEYDLHEIARLCELRADELVEQGSFRDVAAAKAWIAAAEALHDDPTRADLAAELGVDAELLDPAKRRRELRNWIDHVRQRRATESAGAAGC